MAYPGAEGVVAKKIDSGRRMMGMLLRVGGRRVARKGWCVGGVIMMREWMKGAEVGREREREVRRREARERSVMVRGRTRVSWGGGSVGEAGGKRESGDMALTCVNKGRTRGSVRMRHGRPERAARRAPGAHVSSSFNWL